MIAEAQLSDAVERQVRELLADPSIRQSVMGGMAFDYESRTKLEDLSAQVGAMFQDRSMAQVFNGPTWLSGASVVNGTVTADKLVVNSLEAVTTNTGALNVTGNITAAAAFPAISARVVLNSSGLTGYSDATTTTFKLNVDGSGEIGTGANKIVWNTAGVVTVPAASIGSLTIAAVGGGIVGGAYLTATVGSHINFSSTGIAAYNATSEIAANRTFLLDAATGAMTATGSFTIQSAGSGTRVVVSSAGGIEGYNGTTQTFLLNAATGAGQLGPTAGGNYIGWSSTGVTIGGVAMSGGKIVASMLSVTNLAAISADLGTITAGSISASRITAGTFINGSTGTVALGAADMSIASTGKLSWEGGASYIDANGMVLSSTGSFGDSIIWKNGGTTTGSIYSDSTAGIIINGGTGAASEATLTLTSTSKWALTVGSSGGYNIRGGSTYTGIEMNIAGLKVFYCDGANTTIKLADAGGTYSFKVIDSASQTQFSISSNGAFVYPDADGTGLGAYAGRMPWYIAGNLRYVPYYN